MMVPQALAQLEEALASANPEELPALLGKLAEAEAHVRLRLARVVTSARTRTAGDPEPADLITAEEAAALAKATRTPVYKCANCRPSRLWAARLSRRCLRVKHPRLGSEPTTWRCPVALAASRPDAGRRSWPTPIRTRGYARSNERTLGPERPSSRSRWVFHRQRAPAASTRRAPWM